MPKSIVSFVNIAQVGYSHARPTILFAVVNYLTNIPLTSFSGKPAVKAS